jgi:16S rRNA (guanine527-N7)-methyltransferase
MDKLKSGAAALGIDLTSEQLDAFEVYHHELINWNYRVNLTAITDYEEVQTKHFLDSLTAGLAIDFKENPSVIDIGTGAGFPGLPLKIAYSGIHLTLLEATSKKVKFLQHMAQKLGVNNVEIITGRAEETAHDPQYREIFDVVVSRAVAGLPALVELALPFCRIGGSFIAYKKGDIHAEVEQAEKAIETMGGKLKEIVPANPALFDDNRVLVVVEKVRPTPPPYPRRPGMPEKRPILR